MKFNILCMIYYYIQKKPDDSEPSSNSKRNKENSSDVINHAQVKDSIQDSTVVCVSGILNRTEYGRRVLSSYKNTGKLDPKQRKTISSTIAQHFKDNQI